MKERKGYDEWLEDCEILLALFGEVSIETYDKFPWRGCYLSNMSPGITVDYALGAALSEVVITLKDEVNYETW